MNRPEEFIPYGRQTVTADDIESVVEVLKGEWLTQGPLVPTFEKAVAEKVGARHGVALNSATSALHVACIAMGVESGDSVWTTPTTFVASANCARYCSAEIDFVDVSAINGLIDTKELAAKLERARTEGKLPKVVIPVHLAGNSCEMVEIFRLSKEYGFLILEDASHAIGGRLDGEYIGNCRYSHATVFSFHPVKIITTGEGGLVTTNIDSLATRMRLLRSHGVEKEESRFIGRKEGPWHYEQQVLGFNYRMNDIQAALGLSQLKRLDEIVEERNRIYDEYERLLTGSHVRLVKRSPGCLSAMHLAIVQFKDEGKDVQRIRYESLLRKNIGAQLHYSPVHLQPYYRRLGFAEGDFPEAERYSRISMSIPIYPGLTKKEIERVVASVISVQG